MMREEQISQILSSALAWIQRQRWEHNEPIDPGSLFELEKRDLETIQDVLSTCSYVLLRIKGENEAQRKCADLLVCTRHTPSEVIELPTKGYALMRCTGCTRMLFGHQQRYFSRSIFLADINAPPHYTRDRFCTTACRSRYVTYLEENADELFPHI